MSRRAVLISIILLSFLLTIGIVTFAVTSNPNQVENDNSILQDSEIQTELLSDDSN